MISLITPPIRVLTVRQPWAHALVTGVKPVENRARGTSYRGDVAILASRTFDDSDWAMTMVQKCLPPVPKVKMHFGKIIGVVELYDVVRAMDSEWFCGPYGLLVRNARRLREPIPYCGQLSMFAAPLALEHKIRELL